ncbi:MAG: PQQ-binding-like beta-propeller repeat protein [Planctomycetota bacterium]
MNEEPASEEIQTEEDTVETASAREAPKLWPGFVALGLSVGIAIAIQSVAQEIDHQRANIFATIAVSAGLLFLLYRLQKYLLAEDRDWYLLPMIIVGFSAVTMVLFRFEGFSGEMLPQFSWRFAASPDRELQELEIAEPADESATDSQADAGATDDANSPTQLATSRQFLGDERNGVQTECEFRVPESDTEIEVLWDIGIGEGWSSFSVDQGLAVTMEQRDDVECLTCYRLADGKLIWIKQIPARHENLLGGIGPRSTPTIDGDRVYATTATGYLWCVDLQSGRTHWTQNLLELAGWDQASFESAATWGYSISPLLVDGMCIVSLGGPDDDSPPKSLIAFDSTTGDERWRGGDDQLSYASPIIATLGGLRQIVSVNEKTVSGHRLEDGQQLWSFEWYGQTNGGATCASAIPAGESQILLGKGYGGGSALVEVTRASKWKAEAIWTSSRVLQTKFNHTCVRGDIGFGIGNGALQAVQLSDPPKRLWIQPRRSRAGQGQAILCGETLVVQDEAGDVVFVAADATDYRELFRLPALDSKTWNIPTVAGRHLLVRNDRQAICFRLPQADSTESPTSSPE